ncbi:DUF1501 domain-containing protein [Opitutales bacterium]|nr:DUF1501 domain-containing protein [Opitutales bacterium]
MGLFLLVFTTLIATALNGAKEISYDRDHHPRCFTTWMAEQGFNKA